MIYPCPARCNSTIGCRECRKMKTTNYPVGEVEICLCCFKDTENCSCVKPIMPETLNERFEATFRPLSNECKFWLGDGEFGSDSMVAQKFKQFLEAEVKYSKQQLLDRLYEEVSKIKPTDYDYCIREVKSILQEETDNIFKKQ